MVGPHLLVRVVAALEGQATAGSAEIEREGEISAEPPGASSAEMAASEDAPGVDGVAHQAPAASAV